MNSPGYAAAVAHGIFITLAIQFLAVVTLDILDDLRRQRRRAQRSTGNPTSNLRILPPQTRKTQP